MPILIDTLSWIALIGGSVLLMLGGVGLFRFPDFYTRMHAASLTDTGGATLILLGLVLQAGWSLVAVKLLLTLAFLLFTSPTATHALAKAAMHSGLEPWTKESRREGAAPTGDSSRREGAAPTGDSSRHEDAAPTSIPTVGAAPSRRDDK